MAEIDRIIAELREGLEGVTPGPWSNNGKFEPRGMGPSHVVDFGHPPKAPFMIIHDSKMFGKSGVCHSDDQSSVKTASHIARCSPENIRLLLDELSRLRGREEEYRKALEEVVSVSKSGADTVSFLVELQRVARVCARALSPTNQKGDQDGGKPHGGGL